MLRRNGSGSLRGGNRRPVEDINPMATVANLVDAMLVLAVGIMLALIVSWNLNVAENGQVSENVTKDDAISSFDENDVDNTQDEASENLERQGTVYYDPQTDKYYIIANDGSKMSVGE